jgi:hypothetical protein
MASLSVALHEVLPDELAPSMPTAVDTAPVVTKSPSTVEEEVSWLLDVDSPLLELPESPSDELTATAGPESLKQPSAPSNEARNARWWMRIRIP